MPSDSHKPLFYREYTVRWSDLDANRHMANTAYLEFATQARFAYFDAGGFTPADFARHHIGPAILEEHIRYRRECHMMERLTVTVEALEVSPDGSRFRLVNRILKPDGQEAAVITVDAAWFDLQTRKICTPPAPLLELVRAALRDPMG